MLIKWIKTRKALARRKPKKISESLYAMQHNSGPYFRNDKSKKKIENTPISLEINRYKPKLLRFIHGERICL